MKKKLAIAGCKHTTLDLIKGILDGGFSIDLVITISNKKAKSQNVAGYYDLKPFLIEKNIPFYIARKYSLKSEEDQSGIKKYGLDILFCSGWQRLIPEWFLEDLSIGAFGMHGSNKPLPHGRGRSPMNWSLIQNKEMFFTHLFRYKPGVDDGDIVGYHLFDITPFDTALTMHYKNLLAMIRLCLNALPELLEAKVNAVPQPDVEPSFYPKRTAEDGIVHWELSTRDIYNLIRAVTKPFPGAFTYCNHNDDLEKIIIWKAIPFDSHIRWDDQQPGTICQVFYDNSFIVKTGDTSLLVQSFDSTQSFEPKKEIRFHSNGIKPKKWKNLPS
jgi:methionyl-tRNA formyltransferase